jgi:hypothetical protein
MTFANLTRLRFGEAYNVLAIALANKIAWA